MEATLFLQMVVHGIHKHVLYRKNDPIHKDRTECFDDYFPCRKDNDCKQKHVMNWLGLFVDMHNRAVMEKIVKWTSPTHS